MDGISDFEIAWRVLSLSALSSAFIATLYTLFSKDYKLKAGSNSLLIILFTLCVSTVSALIAALSQKFPSHIEIPGIFGLDTPTYFFTLFLSASVILFICSWIGLFWTFLIAYSRIYHLKEKRFIKHIFPFRLFFDIKFKKSETYELEMGSRKNLPELYKSLPISIRSEDIKIINKGYSFLFFGPSNINIGYLAIQLLIDGLINDETANYVCVDKHPITVWECVKKLYPEITQKNKDIIFIDGYTQNYGFDDEILKDKLDDIKNEGVEIVAGKTISGIHTATGTAFKKIKKFEKEERQKNKRRPNRMVYDSISTLQDASSPEEIRIFFNHMIPAEKCYQMITFIVEYNDSKNEIVPFLNRLVDGVIEFKIKDEKILFEITKLRDIDINPYRGEKEWNLQ